MPSCTTSRTSRKPHRPAVACTHGLARQARKRQLAPTQVEPPCSTGRLFAFSAIFSAPPAGFEPATRCLEGSCCSSELRGRDATIYRCSPARSHHYILWSQALIGKTPFYRGSCSSRTAFSRARRASVPSLPSLPERSNQAPGSAFAAPCAVLCQLQPPSMLSPADAGIARRAKPCVRGRRGGAAGSKRPKSPAERSAHGGLPPFRLCFSLLTAIHTTRLGMYSSVRLQSGWGAAGRVRLSLGAPRRVSVTHQGGHDGQCTGDD